MDFEDNCDRIVPAPIPSRIIVSWSKPRCWHGDHVFIRVRTERVLDNSTIELRVFEQGGGAAFDATIPNQPITNNKLDYDYTLNWKTKVNPPYFTQVEATARVVELNLTSARSDTMDVDLIPPLFSA